MNMKIKKISKMSSLKALHLFDKISAFIQYYSQNGAFTEREISLIVFSTQQLIALVYFILKFESINAFGINTT